MHGGIDTRKSTHIFCSAIDFREILVYNMPYKNEIEKDIIYENK